MQFRFIHHRNVSIILQTHVLMVNSDLYRSILKQASALLIFHSLRARQSLKNLSLQLFDNSKFLPAAANDALKTRGPFIPLYLDLRNVTKEQLRVRSGIPGVDEVLSVYTL